MVCTMRRTWRVSGQLGIRCYPTDIQATGVDDFMVGGYGWFMD
jgi:hypothetical protein